MRIYLSPPHPSGKELQYIQDVFTSNYIAPVGAYLERFESAICTYTKAPQALALCSATAGLHLALRVLGIGPGDKVAVSNFTFIASVAPILYQQAEPILIDCDESWQMDLNLLEEALRKERPKAIVLTHIYGGMADMQALVDLVQRYGAHLIEDGAEALGSTYDGKHAGTFGIFGVYSFNGNKLLTTGGGGILVGQDEALMAQARKLATQAKEPDFPWYEHTTYGYNYRLSNVLAAIGVAQMEVIQERIAKKRAIFAKYRHHLEDIATFMPEIPQTRCNRWLTALTFHDKNPLQVQEALMAAGIESRPVWKPMDLQPLFQEARCYSKGVSHDLFARGLCLPSGTQLQPHQIEEICDIVHSC
ncbi:MAG: aminotransferase DegT [Nitratiruptor sp.]|nr:aminotransferase DegT [Nitratiruptor sp.]NPA83364.1 aminotransferase class V-fold PLP-dependent enzyme [Campylobacterota bacterium]